MPITTWDQLYSTYTPLNVRLEVVCWYFNLDEEAQWERLSSWAISKFLEDPPCISSASKPQYARLVSPVKIKYKRENQKEYYDEWDSRAGLSSRHMVRINIELMTHYLILTLELLVSDQCLHDRLAMSPGLTSTVIHSRCQPARQMH